MAFDHVGIAGGRRTIVTAFACGLLSILAGLKPVAAAEYPTKAITIIVPFPAAGSSDVQARLIAKELAARVGRQVIVDNRPGAGGRIGTMLAARAAPDGHTLLFGSITTFAVEPALRKDVGYDVAKDFEPLTLATISPAVLVINPSLVPGSVVDLVALARRRPGELTYASVGPGSTSHLITEAFKASAHVDIVHVPYKGEAPATIDIIGGQVSMMFSSIPAVLPQITAGKLRAIATTGPRRLPFLPDVPTLKEAGIADVEFQAWWAFVAPARTPPEITARLSKELVSVLNSRELSAALERQGVLVATTSQRALAEHMKSQTERFSTLVRAINFKLEE